MYGYEGSKPTSNQSTDIQQPQNNEAQNCKFEKYDLVGKDDTI